MDGNTQRRSAPARARRQTLAVVLAPLLLAGLHADLSGQQVSPLRPDVRPTFQPAALEHPADVSPLWADATPHLAWDARTEVWLLSYSVRFALATELVSNPTRSLPLSGLDPADIRWSFDRGFAGRSDPVAGRASGYTRDAAMLFPLVLSAFMTRPSERWRDLAVGGAVYGEAMLVTSAVTHLAKALIGRPRPGAYLPQPSPLDAGGATPPRPGTFHSMPSSHSSMAWAATSVGLTTHLMLRPEAGWAERLGVGFVGGTLAGVTSALRVHAGAHFPSDVVVGAGIGAASGVLVPLAHRGDQPLPSREAWLQTLAGTAAGTIVGILLGSL